MGSPNQNPSPVFCGFPLVSWLYVLSCRCYVAPTSWIFRLVWAIGARLVDERQRKRVLLLLDKWYVLSNVRLFPLDMLSNGCGRDRGLPFAFVFFPLRCLLDLTNSCRQSRLLEDFDAGILPEHLGGTLKEYPPISARSESTFLS